MNLLESYSHYCGVSPKAPFIDDIFYPIEFDKYVVVQAGAGMPSKTYDYWHEVISHIKLPTIQLGGKDDPVLPVTLGFRGLTTWNQTSHIIKKASLFLGNDSVGNHMASAHGTPRVVLFGATSPLTCGGAWNKHNGIELTPLDMRGCASACHSAQCIRDIKCINTISVHTVLSKIQELLGKDSVRLVDLVYAGPLSNQTVLEWVPLTINQDTFNLLTSIAGTVSLRADVYEPNLNELSNICNLTKLKFVVLVGPENLSNFYIQPDKIERLLIVTDKNNIKQAVARLKEFSKKQYKVGLISRDNHDVFNDYKLDMLDYPPIVKLNDFEYNDSQVEQFVGKEFNVKTARKVIGKNGKMYLTTHDAQNDKNSVEISSDNTYINIEKEHLKELHFLTIRKYA